VAPPHSDTDGVRPGKSMPTASASPSKRLRT
jgi:hypothetical protein